jgi:hypothetical protein
MHAPTNRAGGCWSGIVLSGFSLGASLVFHEMVLNLPVIVDDVPNLSRVQGPSSPEQHATSTRMHPDSQNLLHMRAGSKAVVLATGLELSKLLINAPALHNPEDGRTARRL